jgi:hypothetical protein
MIEFSTTSKWYFGRLLARRYLYSNPFLSMIRVDLRPFFCYTRRVKEVKEPGGHGSFFFLNSIISKNKHMSQGMESMGLDLDEQAKLKVTFPGQAGYRGAWDESATSVDQPEATKDMVRDAAIEGADLEDLTAALDRLDERHKNGAASATELTALAQIRSRVDEMIKRNQH